MAETIFPVSLLYFSILQYDPQVGTYLHRHTGFYQIQCLVRGTGVIRIEQQGEMREYELTQDTLAILPPGCLHGMKRGEEGEAPVPYFDIKFALSDANLQAQLGALAPVRHIGKPEMDLIMRLSKVTEQQTLRDAICTALVCELANQHAGQIPPVKAGVCAASLAAYRYILQHSDRNLSLEDVCAATSYNKTYLSAVFRRDFNLTVNEFILSQRIRRAKEMLRYSEYGIGGIASQLGFASVAHFSRLFKEATGQTPSRFRKLNG